MPTKGPITTARPGTKGAMGPSPYHRGGTPTRAKVMRAKLQAVGGGRKRCKRGKNCSAACIQSGMTCLVEFPLPVATGLSNTRNALAEYITKKNNITPGSIQDKRINAALNQMSSILEVKEGSAPGPRSKTGLAKPEVTVKTDTRRASRKGLLYNEIQGVKALRNRLEEAESQEQAARALIKEATSRGLRLPRAELEMIYSVLPEATQKALAKSGQADGRWYAGRDEQGNIKFSKTQGKERALAVLDLYLRQGGTDAYNSRGSKIWAPGDLSIEHFIPLSKGGIDAPSNWVLVRRGVNTAKSTKELGKWVDSLPNSREEYKAYAKGYAKQQRVGRVKKAAEESIDPKKLTSQQMFNLGAPKIARAFKSENNNVTPSIFTKEWLTVGGGSDRTGNAGPPAPFAKGLGLIARDKGLVKARDVSLNMRSIWNDDWKRNGSISKQEAYQKLISEVRGAMNADDFNNLFLPAAQSWARSNGFL